MANEKDDGLEKLVKTSTSSRTKFEKCRLLIGGKFLEKGKDYIAYRLKQIDPNKIQINMRSA